MELLHLTEREKFKQGEILEEGEGDEFCFGHVVFEKSMGTFSLKCPKVKIDLRIKLRREIRVGSVEL